MSREPLASAPHARQSLAAYSFTVRTFGGFAPFGLFITPDDTLFVADGRAHRVIKMTVQGKVLDTFGKLGPEPGHFFLPHGITVAKDGSVYVTEINGKRVQKFIPSK